MKYRELIKQLEAAGWYFQRYGAGSHMLYKHPTRPGAIVVAGGGKLNREVPKGRKMRSCAKQDSSEEDMKYVYVIEKANDGSYSAYVPDLPGCTTSGDSVDEVKASIKDAVNLYVDSLRENNEPVPQPTSITDVVDAA